MSTSSSIKVSICIATYNRPEVLARTLDSILCQNVPFGWEIIVSDDSSAPEGTCEVCRARPSVRYIRHIRNETGDRTYANPARPRNTAYRAARGDVLICQSDDVMHHSPDCVRNLTERLEQRTFLLATVVNVDRQGRIYSNPEGKGYGDQLTTYVSPLRRRPLFFLGSLYRADLCAVGGNDEEFIAPSGEDVWFGHCLIRGRGLSPIYSSDIVGHHQAHSHCDPICVNPSQILLQRKVSAARNAGIPSAWCSSGGPWTYP